MQRISEIREKRERVFYKNRMAGNKEKEKEANRKLVAENEHLLPRVRASEKAAEELAEPVMIEETEVEKLPEQRQKEKLKSTKKIRQRMLVGGGVENEMDVD